MFLSRTRKTGRGIGLHSTEYREYCVLRSILLGFSTAAVSPVLQVPIDEALFTVHVDFVAWHQVAVALAKSMATNARLQRSGGRPSVHSGVEVSTVHSLSRIVTFY